MTFWSSAAMREGLKKEIRHAEKTIPRTFKLTFIRRKKKDKTRGKMLVNETNLNLCFSKTCRKTFCCVNSPESFSNAFCWFELFKIELLNFESTGPILDVENTGIQNLYPPLFPTQSTALNTGSSQKTF